MKISLEQFIKNTKGTKVDVPWSSGRLIGQCVSLIQQYIGQCLDQPMKARGNAKDWVSTYVSEGLGYIVKTPRKGDLLVYGASMGGGYGHIAIYVGPDQMYDQNNSTHDNLCAGYSKIFGGYTILRPNSELIEDTTLKTLYLPANADRWRIYPLDKTPTVGNEKGFLFPSKFGGLNYAVVSMAQSNVAIIDTRDYGRVQIYVDPSTGAIIK